MTEYQPEYLRMPLRSLRQACRALGRDDEGRNCAGCSLRAMCQTEEMVRMDAGASPTVLLVDDDGDVLEIAGMLLSDAGYTVISAASGVDALGALRTHPEVALLLTDIVMPGMNGFELAHLAKRMRPELRVIYATGHLPTSITGDHGMGHGPLVQKPWRGEQVVTVIRDVLGGSAAL